MKRVLDIANQPDINSGTSTNLLTTDIYLYGLVLRIKLGVREIGTKHQQCVTFLYRFVGRGHAEKAIESNEKGIVVLKRLFASETIETG